MKCRWGGGVSALSTGACTATLCVMVTINKGGGCAPPTLTSQGLFFNHDGMYARNRPLLLCVYSVVITRHKFVHCTLPDLKSPSETFSILGGAWGVAYLGFGVAKLGRCVAKLGRCVDKLGGCMAKLGGCVAKLRCHASSVSWDVACSLFGMRRNNIKNTKNLQKLALKRYYFSYFNVQQRDHP